MLGTIDCLQQHSITLRHPSMGCRRCDCADNVRYACGQCNAISGVIPGKTYLHVVTTALSASWALHLSELQRSVKSITPVGYSIEDADVIKYT